MLILCIAIKLRTDLQYCEKEKPALWMERFKCAKNHTFQEWCVDGHLS